MGVPEELRQAQLAKRRTLLLLRCHGYAQECLSLFFLARAHYITECVIHPGTKLNTCVAMGRGTVGVTARPAVAEDLQALRRVHVSRLGGVGREADFESNFLCWWLNSRRYSFIFPDNTHRQHKVKRAAVFRAHTLDTAKFDAHFSLRRFGRTGEETGAPSAAGWIEQRRRLEHGSRPESGFWSAPPTAAPQLSPWR